MTRNKRGKNMKFDSTLLNDFASIATIVGILLAVLTFLYTAYQVQLNTKTNTGTFWLELEKMFSNHDDVHIKLRLGGEWAINNSGPENAIYWAKVEDYMGLFEHCEIMLQKKLIDWNTFHKIFSYRIYNIMANERIVQAKLVNEKKSWEDFLKLLKRMGINCPT